MIITTMIIQDNHYRVVGQPCEVINGWKAIAPPTVKQSGELAKNYTCQYQNLPASKNTRFSGLGYRTRGS